MKSLLPAALMSVMLGFPATLSAQLWPGGAAQPPAVRYPSAYVPNYAAPSVPATLTGRWYMNGEANNPTAVVQYGPNRALFINEHGSQAWGTIRGNHVWIPSWSSSLGPGLVGTVHWGSRIVWPDGSFWSRQPM